MKGSGEQCGNKKCIEFSEVQGSKCLKRNWPEECKLYEPLKEKTEPVAEVPCSDGLSDVSLAEALHYAGLDAHHNYKKMGFSSDEWNGFRLKIAKFLLSEFDIARKDR